MFVSMYHLLCVVRGFSNSVCVADWPRAADQSLLYVRQRADVSTGDEVGMSTSTWDGTPAAAAAPVVATGATGTLL